MLEIDEKAMAYCLVEALFAAGVINLPTYQNFLRMKREQEEEPPAKSFVNNRERLWWRGFCQSLSFCRRKESETVEVKIYESSCVRSCFNRT